jgi:serine/threonine-protein kinase
LKVSSEQAADVLLGQMIAGKYRIDSVIGEGGMGFVFAAHHMQLETKVAIKLLKAELASNAEAVARFAREGRAAVRIVNQHVARVFDVGTMDNGAPYMVMEYLDGDDLASVITKRGPMPVQEAVDYVLQACEALAEAHNAGVVHRDLKPANLFCARQPNGTAIIKVLDFGISKITGPIGAQLNPKNTTAIMGSPFYMSPEQMASTQGVDARTDIWGLGVILYELVTGKPPFDGNGLPEIVMRVATEAPPSLRSSRPDLPAAFEVCILRCLEKDRNNRYKSVGELAIDLGAFGSRRGRVSVENILRTLQISKPDALSQSTLGPGAPREGARTIEPFGQTQTELPMRGVSGKAILLGVGIGVLLLVGAIGIRSFLSPSRSKANAVAQPTATAALVPVAVASVAPEPTPSTPAAAPEPATTRAAPAASAAQGSKKAAPVATTRAAPKTKANCDPNFYLDGQGEKHFKPECFQ